MEISLNTLSNSIGAAWDTSLVALACLAVQVVLLVLVIRRHRASQRLRRRLLHGDSGSSKSPPRPSAAPLIISVVCLLALPTWTGRQISQDHERAAGALEGKDPARHGSMLESVGPTSLDRINLSCGMLLLQLLVAAPVIGLAVASRQRGRNLARAMSLTRAADKDEAQALTRHPGVGAGTAVGFCYGCVALVAAPLGLGVLSFVGASSRLFEALAGMDPARQDESLLVGLEELQTCLKLGAQVSAGGVAIVSVLAFLLFFVWSPSTARRRLFPGAPVGPSWRVTLLASAACLLAAGGLWLLAQPYHFTPPRMPADGPIARIIRASGRPPDWAARLSKLLDDPALRSRAERLTVVVTARSILVDGEPAAKLRGGAVPAELKRGGETGYVITPLFDVLSKHRARLQRIEKLTGGKMKADDSILLAFERQVPFRLLSEVMVSAQQAKFSSYQLWDFPRGGRVRLWPPPLADAELEAWKRKIGQVPARAPSYRREGPDDPPPPGKGLNLTVVLAYSGFIVAGAGGVMVGPDGRTPTVKCKVALKDNRCPGGQYDFEALTRLLTTIKTKFPGERRVILSADRMIPSSAVLKLKQTVTGRATDTCTGGDGCLFDEVILLAGVQ